MFHALDRSSALVIIGTLVPLWCAAIATFAIVKSSKVKRDELSTGATAFNDTLALFGVRSRRKDDKGRSSLAAGFANPDRAAQGE